MNKYIRALILLCSFYFAADIHAQASSITWPLSSTTNFDLPQGNIQGFPEYIGAGHEPFLSVYGYKFGQELWAGNTGWVAGTFDPSRFAQFDASPMPGNILTVTNVSFNYGDYPAAVDSNKINSDVYYSTDNWVHSTLLTSNLVYSNTTFRQFIRNVNVVVEDGGTFSLRIYPYAVLKSNAVNPSYAIHSNVVISGITSSKKSLKLTVTDINAQLNQPVFLTAKLEEPGAKNNSAVSNKMLKFSVIASKGSTSKEIFTGNATTDTSGAALLSYTLPGAQDLTSYSIIVSFPADSQNPEYKEEAKLILPVVTGDLPEKSPITFTMHPSLGFTYTSSSLVSGETENLQWLLNFQATLGYFSDNFQFDSDVFIQFGQIVAKGLYPVITQDNLIMDLMPSMKLLESPGVRLFWQTKIETQMQKGIIDNQETAFFDPAFLTHTLFVGNKNQLLTQTPLQNLQITYGVGYSFQQIIKKHFQLTNESQPNSSIDYIQGPTIIFNLVFTKQITEDISTSVSLNSLFLAKSGFLQSSSNSRFSSMLTASLDYSIISLQYSNRLVYDKALSNRRQLEQTLVLALKFTL